MANGKPGAPIGNQNGAKGRLFAAAVERALSKKSKGEQVQALDEIAEKLVTVARAGDLEAIKIIADRMDGKPHQTIAAEVDSTVTVEVVRFGVEPKA